MSTSILMVPLFVKQIFTLVRSEILVDFAP